MDKNYIGRANFLPPVVMKNDERPELTGELRESFCSTDPGITRRFAETVFLADNRADLAGVSVPSLILQCSEDAIAPVEVGSYLERNMPRSTLQRMKATGHCPHISHPQAEVRWTARSRPKAALAPARSSPWSFRQRPMPTPLSEAWAL